MSITKQYITRKGGADICHRVMNEYMKCFNVHGHRYEYELTFEFTSSADIGYNIDFKEIKRVGCQWIDDMWDHGAVLNPKDTTLIGAVNELGTKLWTMSLNGEGEYCNPSVENIAKELFLVMDILFGDRFGLKIHEIRMYETPNCFTDCTRESITADEYHNFMKARKEEVLAYKAEKGVVEYDDRI